MFGKVSLTVSVAVVFFCVDFNLAISASHRYRQSSNQKIKRFSAEETQKLRKAEETADQFITRWHQTFDLNLLFDEFFSREEFIQQQYAQQFCGFYEVLTETESSEGEGDSCGSLKALLETVGIDRVRENYFAWSNLAFAGGEYELAFGEDARPEEVMKLLDELSDAQRKYDIEEGKALPISRANEFLLDEIEGDKKVLALFRKYLTPEALMSETYRKNYQAKQTDRFSRIIIDEIENEIVARWKLDKGRSVYYVPRGVFDLYFIEEDGQFKILTINDAD